MKILPHLDEVREFAETGRYKVVPVSCEILSDFTTPIETMKILKNISSHCYMLESAQANDKWGRYTFLGFDPEMEITCVDGEMNAGSLKVKTEHPSDYLRQILAEYKSPRLEYLPSFTGGLVGYFSYDYLGYREPAVRCRVQDSEDFKDVDLMLFDKVIAFDNVRQKIILIVNMSLSDVETSYNKAVMELRQLSELLKKGAKKEEPGGRLTGEVKPLFSKKKFCAMVERQSTISARAIFSRSCFPTVCRRPLKAASFRRTACSAPSILPRICFIFQELMWRSRERRPKRL